MAKEGRKVLGKGLGALLGDVAEADNLRKPIDYLSVQAPVRRQSDILMVPVDKVEVNPCQPRLEFNAEALEELSSSIRHLGLIQPITVRRIDDGKFQIISGERRYRACRMAGMETIPAYVREADDVKLLEMALMENIQREDLDPIEIALSLRALMDECSLTQEQLSERVSKKRASVANYLRLLRLPDRIQHDLRDGLLSVGHAKVLLGVDDAELQQKLCDAVIRDSLTVRQLEALLPKDRTAGCSDAVERLKPFFKGKVTFRRSPSGKGSITLRFDSDAEVESFLKHLK